MTLTLGNKQPANTSLTGALAYNKSKDTTTTGSLAQSSSNLFASASVATSSAVSGVSDGGFSTLA